MAADQLPDVFEGIRRYKTACAIADIDKHERPSPLVTRERVKAQELVDRALDEGANPADVLAVIVNAKQHG